MTKLREPLSIEFVLSQVLPKLEDEEVKKSTGKSISHFRKCGDADDKDHNIYLADAIKLDIILDRINEGTPLLNTFLHVIDKKRSESNEESSISHSIMQIVSRIGKLTDVTEKALDPKSQSGSSVSNQEKDRIYKALKEVEAKIASLKKSID